MEERTGNCFEVAARIVTKTTSHNDDTALASDVQRGLDYVAVAEMGESIFGKVDEVKLMHGVVKRPSDGLLHLHAWVEVRFANKQIMCLDVANGREWWGRSHDYYMQGVMMTTEYSAAEARKHLAGFETWGPWHLSEPDTQKCASI